MTRIATTNNVSGTAAALIPAADANNPSATQDFQRMLRSHAAQLSIVPAPAPQVAQAAPAAPQVARPKDDISDTQREETRLSNMRKQNPAAMAKPIKTAPCTTNAAAGDDGGAAPDDAAQETDANLQGNTKPPAPSTPASAADTRSARLAAAKGGKKASDDNTAAPGDTKEEECSAPEMRSTTGDTGTAAATLDPAAVLAAAQLNDKTAAALQTDGSAAGKQRAEVADLTQDRQARQAAGADAAAETSQARSQQASDAVSADGAASFAGLLGAAGKQAGASAASIAPGAVDHGASAQLAALAGLPSAASNSTAGTAAPTASTPSPLVLSQPLHDPSFASEMSAKLSVLASQGVQEAQLHLNPAEMGPVQVQIVVDGQQAQVSFHAEHAETRAVLERGLPDLAAALRDTGLTLSGGGVFQTASGGSGGNNNGSFQQQGRDGAASSAAGNGRIQRMTSADDALPAISRAGGARGGPVRGVVDLYA